MRFSPHGIAFDNGSDTLHNDEKRGKEGLPMQFWKMNGAGNDFIVVDMTGGALYVDVERDGNGRITDLYLTGPTNIVCKGEAVDENMKW